jgi:signal transduction histidine kinase
VKPFAQWGLSARILAILALVLVLDLTVNVYLFERATQFILAEEEAARFARRLAEADSALSHASPDERPALARDMSNAQMQIDWSADERSPMSGIQLATLQEQLIRHQPALARARMQMLVSPLQLTDGLTGTLILADGSVMRFRNHTHAAWPLVLGHLANFLLPTSAFALLAWLLTYASLRPLRKLVRASLRVGTRHASPINVAGPAEVQLLIRAFNSMQERIDALLDANGQTMLAIAHDLRTPLARLQLRVDAIGMADEERQELESDLGEIGDLLFSLQNYVELDAAQAPREPVDLAAMAQTLVDQACERGKLARYFGPDRLVVHARPVALRRALANVIDNALHYGGHADVTVKGNAWGVSIAIEDEGPGIPVESLDLAMQPFVRLDDARERNTSGMGLGLAIVDRAIRGEGGTFTLSNRPTKGLKALIRLPQSAVSGVDEAPATLPYN